MTRPRKVKGISDKERIDWLQEVGAISWSGEELKWGVFPDTWDSSVVRVAIDAAIRAGERASRSTR